MVPEREKGAWRMGVEVGGDVGDVYGEVNGGLGEVSLLVDQIL